MIVCRQLQMKNVALPLKFELGALSVGSSGSLVLARMERSNIAPSGKYITHITRG